MNETCTLTNLFNWIVLTLGRPMYGDMTVQWTPNEDAPDHYRDVQFKITHDAVNGVEAEIDFQLLHALVIALEPSGDVSIGVAEYEWDRPADLVIQLNRVLRSGVITPPGELSDFQVLAIKRLGGYRPYENSPDMHRDQGK